MERKTLSGYIGTVIAAGAIGVLGGREIDRHSNNEPIVRNSVETQNSPKPITVIGEEEIKQAIRKSNIDTVFNNYKTAHHNLQRPSNEIVSINGKKLAVSSDLMPEALRIAAKTHLMEGIALVNFISQENRNKPDFLQDPASRKTEPAIKLDPNSNTLSVEKIKLDLNDPFQFRLAQALIYIKFEIQDYIRSQIPSIEPIESEKDFIWLAESGIKVTIEQNIEPLITDDHLKILAKSLKTLERSKLPYPEFIKYKIKEDTDESNGAAWYLPHWHKTPFGMVITELANEETIYHELGHFVSDSNWIPGQESNSRLKQISQEEFTKMLKALQQENRHRIPITFADYNPSSEETSFVEEYAEVFRSYFYNGREFRKQIKEAADMARKKLLLTEYNFMKSLAGGVEFEYGKPITILTKETQIFKYDSVQIADLDPYSVGIILHPEPDLSSINPDYPLVQDGNFLVILDGPFEARNEKNEPIEFWKVKHTQSGKDKVMEYEGWISREYFYKLTPANRFTIPQTNSQPAAVPLATP